jgi:hypothetical protein
MRGVITTRDVMKNSVLIWREFGPRCLARCLWACVCGPKTTFLTIAFRK